MFDKDLIVNAQIFDYGAHETFERTLKWFLCNIVRLVEIRKEDLWSKRPGAVTYRSEPRFIWVKALNQLEILLEKRIYSLICKFNATLEEVVMSDKHSHILKVDLLFNNSNFKHNGSLMQIGKIEYWKYLDNQLKSFDRGYINLKPTRLNVNVKGVESVPQCRSSHDRMDQSKWDRHSRDH